MDAPNSTLIQLTRSGDWEATGAITVGDQQWLVTLHNRVRGSDSHPPSEGPAQQPVTMGRLRSVLQHLATELSEA